MAPGRLPVFHPFALQLLEADLGSSKQCLIRAKRKTKFGKRITRHNPDTLLSASSEAFFIKLSLIVLFLCIAVGKLWARPEPGTVGLSVLDELGG